MTTLDEPIRVLVADERPEVGRSLGDALGVERDLEVLDLPAGTADEVTGAAAAADVVVLVGDLGSGLGSAALLRRLAQRRPGPAWVALVSPDGDRWADLDGVIEDVLAAGAHGCLVETSTPLQIAAAVRAAARGERAPERPGEHPVTGPLVQRLPRESAPLTEREVHVLRLVEQGLGNQEVADRLYLSVSSVKSHLSHTYGRLGVNQRDAAVAEARRQGLL